MNCRRVQTLLPLYIEGDLGSEQMSRIAAHVEWCGQCNWIADEYRESQSWIRGDSALEFDKDSLDRMKAGVLSEISAQRKGVSIFSSLSSLAERWTRRNVLAVAVGMIIVMLAGFYVYRAMHRIAAAPDVEANVQHPESQGDPNANATAYEPLRLTQSTRHPKHRRRVSAYAARSMPTTSDPAATVARAASPVPKDDSKNLPDSRDMLRIEIQTADPMIRIIWFAPKETENHQTKPATD